ncbi:MAG TPA: hypothetical protein VFS15_15395 [Kofleriaceae bacterium]|nr:hypothetical protein [Kofleriaceae bacterium]
MREEREADVAHERPVERVVAGTRAADVEREAAEQHVHAERARDRQHGDRRGAGRARALREPRRGDPQHEDFGEELRLDVARDRRPLIGEPGKPRLARERDDERRGVDADEYAQDGAEIAEIRQSRSVVGGLYNPRHSGVMMQSSCRLPALPPARSDADPDAHFPPCRPICPATGPASTRRDGTREASAHLG